MTTPRTPQQGSRPPFRRGGRRRRQCFCKENTVDYKDVSSIRRFITDRGRIEAGKKSGNCAKCQRNLTIAIKRARHLALLPYAPDHLRVTGAVAANTRVSDDEEATEDGETPESSENTDAATAPEAAEATETVAEVADESDDAAEDKPEAEVAEPEAEAEVEEPEAESEPASEDVSSTESEAESEEQAPEPPETPEATEPESEVSTPEEETSTDDEDDK